MISCASCKHKSDFQSITDLDKSNGLRLCPVTFSAANLIISPDLVLYLPGTLYKGILRKPMALEQ